MSTEITEDLLMRISGAYDLELVTRLDLSGSRIGTEGTGPVCGNKGVRGDDGCAASAGIVPTAGPPPPPPLP